MKKNFTFFIAMVVTLSMYAVTPVQSADKLDPTGHATQLADKKLQHHKQVAKVLGLDQFDGKPIPKTTPNIQKAPKAKVQSEVMTLNYDAFSFMEYDADMGDWMIGLNCDDWSRPEYAHFLQLNWHAPANNPCGTFTTEDFVYDLTHMLTPYSYGSIMFDEVNMTLSSEKISDNLQRYTLDATLVDTEGNTYIVHAKHENIVAKGEVAVYIDNATLTQSNNYFTVEGKNNDLELKLVVNNSDVIGVYNKNMIDWNSSKFSYKGKEVTPLSFKAIVDLATHTETGALAYVAQIIMMGNDTIDYNVVLAAPLSAPTDTIELTAIDLLVDDSYALWIGMVDFYANTPEFSIRGGWHAEYAEEGTYDAAIFLDDANNNTITSLHAQVTVTLDKENNWVIDGTMLGNDNKVYNLHLTRTIPEQTKTVLVAFETSAQAKYYPAVDMTINDLQLYHEDDRYRVSINVSDVEMGSEFDEEYINSAFSYLEAKDGTPITVAEIRDGKLYQVGDTTKMEADFVTFEGVLYQVRLWYVAPTPTKTVTLDITNADCYLDFEYSGQYTLFGYSNDGQYSFAVTVPALTKEDIPGTFVNDGLFGKFGDGQYEFDASNSFVGKYNPQWEAYDLYYIQKGQITVTLDEEDNITLTASVVCEDAVQYNVKLTSKYKEPHIDYDAEEGPVDRVYGPGTEVTINDRTADYGLVYLQLTDNVEGDVTAVYFVLSEADPKTIIPVGTYEINDTWFDGTVTASMGINMEGSVIPSYYAGYVDGWLVDPFYFFQTGTVVVTKDENDQLSFEINALNSCGIPVHIVYGNAASGVENIDVNLQGIKKQIIDGQLVIIRDGKAYNAIGAQVK